MFYTNPRVRQVDPRTLAVLRKIAKHLGVRDIGLSPERKEIYLLSSARVLQRVIDSWFLRGWEQRTHGHTLDRTWSNLNYTLPSILNELEVPCPNPNPSKEYGQWDEWAVIVIPSPGGPQHKWWSAKTGRMMSRVRVEPVSFCSKEPVSFGSATGPVLIANEDGKTPPIFVEKGE